MYLRLPACPPSFAARSRGIHQQMTTKKNTPFNPKKNHAASEYTRLCVYTHPYTPCACYCPLPSTLHPRYSLAMFYRPVDQRRIFLQMLNTRRLSRVYRPPLFSPTSPQLRPPSGRVMGCANNGVAYSRCVPTALPTVPARVVLQCPVAPKCCRWPVNLRLPGSPSSTLEAHHSLPYRSSRGRMAKTSRLTQDIQSSTLALL